MHNDWETTRAGPGKCWQVPKVTGKHLLHRSCHHPECILLIAAAQRDFLSRLEGNHVVLMRVCWNAERKAYTFFIDNVLKRGIRTRQIIQTGPGRADKQFVRGVASASMRGSRRDEAHLHSYQWLLQAGHRADISHVQPRPRYLLIPGYTTAVYLNGSLRICPKQNVLLCCFALLHCIDYSRVE